jgi:hypothetical protein
LFVDLFLEAHQQPPTQIILDLDATDDPLHGHQEGRFFHGYYDCYCYLPLYIFCGTHLLAAKLRRQYRRRRRRGGGGCAHRRADPRPLSLRRREAIGTTRSAFTPENPQRREAGRSPSPATHEIRTGHQSEDCQGLMLIATSPRPNM